MKLKENHSSDEGEDDSERGGESFEDVVGIFDDKSGDESSQDLSKDDTPSPESEVGKNPLGWSMDDRSDGRRGEEGEVGEEDGDEGREHRKEGELTVSSPKVDLGTFEDFLKVDSGHSTSHAPTGDG